MKSLPVAPRDNIPLDLDETRDMWHALWRVRVEFADGSDMLIGHFHGYIKCVNRARSEAFARQGIPRVDFIAPGQ